MDIAYYNGEITTFAEARIPLTDRSIFFGDGIYDAAIGRNGKIYLEKEHFDRFFGNAERLGIAVDKTPSELSEIIRELIKESGYEEYFVYIQLSAASQKRMHQRELSGYGNLLITVRNSTLPPQDKELKLFCTEDIRHTMCDVKTLNLLPAVMAETRARELGCDEALFRRGAIITECSHSNVAMIKGGTLYTHPDGKYILPGITKRRLLVLCERLLIPFRTTQFTLDEMLCADEVLVSSTSKLCLRATEIDKIPLKRKNFAVGERLISAIFEDFRKSMG